MPKKILVVDDEFTIRELVELTLSPDYDIIKAENGEEALKLVKDKPDLIILDIMMPKIDGYHVCQKVRENPETQHIPIIMLTAKHGIEDLKEAIRSDVDEYITKPFEPELLKKRVDEYTSGSYKPARRRLFQVGKSLHYIKEKL